MTLDLLPICQEAIITTVGGEGKMFYTAADWIWDSSPKPRFARKKSHRWAIPSNFVSGGMLCLAQGGCPKNYPGCEAGMIFALEPIRMRAISPASRWSKNPVRSVDIRTVLWWTCPAFTPFDPIPRRSSPGISF